MRLGSTSKARSTVGTLSTLPPLVVLSLLGFATSQGACAAPPMPDPPPSGAPRAPELESEPQYDEARLDASNTDTEDDELDVDEPPPAPACATQTAVFSPVIPRSNVLFVLDRSGSMHIRLPNGGTRWTATRDTLVSMLGKLKTMNARASVLQFPAGDPSLSCCGIDANNDAVCTCSSLPAPTKRCSASTYKPSNPVTLDQKQIDLIKAQINASNDTFYWGTPIAAALTAAVNAQKASKNDGVKSVVLLTDGAPSWCASDLDPKADDIQRVVDAARAGMNSPQKIRTYVIGIMDPNGDGAPAALLSKVASAGGTERTPSCRSSDSCFYPVSTTSLASTLSSTLSKIARDAADCTFQIPEPTTADPEVIDVTLTRTGGPQILVRDKTHREGWDLEGDKTFRLFGESCRVFKEDPKAKVHVVLGCNHAPG